MSRHTVRAYIGLGANIGDADGDAGPGGRRTAALPGVRLRARLAPLRHRARGRDRPARVPQRGRGAGRPGRGRTRPRAPWRCWPSSRPWSASPAGRSASAGARANSTWTCSSSGVRGSPWSGRPSARSNDVDADPAKATKLLVVPHPEARRPPVRPRAALGSRPAGSCRPAGVRRWTPPAVDRKPSRARTPCARSAAGTGSRPLGRALGGQPRRRFGMTSRPKTSMNSVWLRPTLWRWTSS